MRNLATSHLRWTLGPQGESVEDFAVVVKQKRDTASDKVEDIVEIKQKKQWAQYAAVDYTAGY